MEHQAETTVLDKPVLAYNSPGLVTIAGLNVSVIEIPLLLTSYTPPSRKATVNNVGLIPIINGDNLAYGGSATSIGASSLPVVVLEGTIDTPGTPEGKFYVPDILFEGYRWTYGQFIAACIEGRMSLQPGWGRVDPIWFRDPFGRVYNNPRILDFTASYVEAVPGRNSFTMQLKV